MNSLCLYNENSFSIISDEDSMEINGGILPLLLGMAVGAVIVFGAAVVVAGTIVAVTYVVQSGYNYITGH